MGDDKFDLTRRRVLGGLGAIGAGAALGGAGTMAYFSDQETFTNNEIVAGQLDMVVDWQEAYNGVNIEAFPDNDGAENGGDGTQDEYSNPCGTLANVPADLSSDVRTNGTIEGTGKNDFAVSETTNPGDPLVDLDDLKPGDEGEVTFSFHLCSNPGYVWMNGNLIENAENGFTEPERQDADEDGDAGSMGGELADAVRTRLWYDDDCDNEVDGGEAGDDLDVMLVLDRSGSMDDQPNKFQNMKDGAKSLVDTLTDDDQAGLASFSTGATRDVDLTDTTPSGRSTVNTAIDGLSSGGQTNIAAGIQYAAEELQNDESLYGTATSPSGNAESDHAKIMVVLSNGGENIGDAVAAAQTAKDDGIRIFSIAYGSGADVSLLQDVASSGDFYDSSSIGDIQQVFDQIAEDIAGEEVFFEGSLAEAIAALSSGHGVPLDGDRITEFDELMDDDSSAARECFEASTTHCVGFEWWLPVDHANEIQTDSVKFDLGFYTEQCRHNDGSGIADVV